MDILMNAFSWIIVGASAGFVVFILCACKLGSDYERDFIEDSKVAYICDGRECVDGCRESECRHTYNIEHAKNFKSVGDGKWMEVE